MNLPSEHYTVVAQAFWQKAFFDSVNDPFSQSETVKAVDPATEEEIRAAEQELGRRLPDSYKWFQQEFGNFQNAVPDIYTVRALPKPMRNMVGIARSEQTECFPNMPLHLIAFSDNGGGDSYCFDISHYVGNECSIVLWNHENDEQQTPRIVAPTFLDWLEDELNAPG